MTAAPPPSWVALTCARHRAVGPQDAATVTPLTDDLAVAEWADPLPCGCPSEPPWVVSWSTLRVEQGRRARADRATRGEVCRGTTLTGDPCRLAPLPASAFCRWHDPARQERQR